MADETVNSDTQNAESINDILEETPEETTVDNSQLEEKNKQLFERAKKAEAEAKELRAKVGEAKPSESNLTMEAIMVGKKLDKYSEEEIQSIAKIIKSDKPSDILAALDNPFIKQGIDTAREKVTKEKDY
jgi:alanyl-tRNA synthetase